MFVGFGKPNAEIYDKIVVVGACSDDQEKSQVGMNDEMSLGCVQIYCMSDDRGSLHAFTLSVEREEGETKDANGFYVIGYG